MPETSTPLMRQYNSIKQKYPQALLFFRLGDFYELFFEDAVLASRELQITLTSRNKEKGVAVPMCGVPHHAADTYISRLIRKGHKVAVCEQMEEPRLAKKLVRREVTRVITPGTASGTQLLSPRENNYLVAACRSGERIGLACVDLSTGEFRGNGDGRRRPGSKAGRGTQPPGSAGAALPVRQTAVPGTGKTLFFCRSRDRPSAPHAHRSGRMGLWL